MKKENINKAYIGKLMDGEWVGEWKNAKLNKIGIDNVLMIKKSGNKISYYVNSKKILTKNFEGFFGNYLGVGCQGPQNVSFDYISVKQDKKSNDYLFAYQTNRKANNIKNKTEINLIKSGSLFEVPVELNGVLKINFIFDTGASDVSISPDIALTLIKTGTIQENDWLPGAYYQFADGSIAKSMRFKLKSVKIGDKVVYDIICSISNSIDAPMLLGQSVLSKFGNYSFNYNQQKLIFE